MATPSNDRRSWLALLAFAVLLTAGHYLHARPLDRPMYDDTAIMLKYLDNFAAHCFYCYNPGERVFGFSSPVHAFLTGGLAALKVRPEVTVVVSNILGSILFYFCSGLIYRRAFHSTLLALVGVSAVFAASMYARETFMTGMETPLHVGIVYAAIAALLAGSAWFDALCALAIVSKLDAVAIIGVLQLVSWGRTLQQDGLSPQRIRRFALGFIAPLAAWCVFAFVAFGSPLPQSFLAKQFLHSKATGGWFPFLEPLYVGRAALRDALLFFSASLAAIGLAVVSRRISASLLFSLGALATLVPYYFYNPGEQMHWYYAMPELLFLSAGVTLPGAVADALVASPPARRRLVTGVTALIPAAGVLLRAPASDIHLRGAHRYLDIVETDRVAAGQALGRATPESALVYAGHGHIAREAHRRVIDYSGLNSRFATDHRNNLAAMFADAPPAAITLHGFVPEELQRRYHLLLEASFYNVTEYGADPFRMFVARTGSTPIAERLSGADVVDVSTIGQQGSVPALRGKSLSLVFKPEEGVEGLSFGVPREKVPRVVSLTTTAASGPATVECPIPAETELPHFRLADCLIRDPQRAPFTGVTITAKDGQGLKLVDPAVLRTQP